jgi:hypothetical protein
MPRPAGSRQQAAAPPRQPTTHLAKRRRDGRGLRGRRHHQEALIARNGRVGRPRANLHSVSRTRAAAAAAAAAWGRRAERALLAAAGRARGGGAAGQGGLELAPPVRLQPGFVARSDLWAREAEGEPLLKYCKQAVAAAGAEECASASHATRGSPGPLGPFFWGKQPLPHVPRQQPQRGGALGGRQEHLRQPGSLPEFVFCRLTG